MKLKFGVKAKKAVRKEHRLIVRLLKILYVVKKTGKREYKIFREKTNAIFRDKANALLRSIENEVRDGNL